MPKLTWRGSYETLKFNTPDGDLHKGQYAVNDNGDGTKTYFIRTESENKAPFSIIDTDHIKDVTPIIQNLTLVEIVSDGKMYYSEFELSSDKNYRQVSTKSSYDKQNITKGVFPSKTLTAKQIQDLLKEVF